MTSYLRARPGAEYPDLNDPPRSGRSTSRCWSTSPSSVRCCSPQHVFVFAMFVLVVVLAWALFRTRWGLRVRAVGEHPSAADTVGIDVQPHPLPRRDARRGGGRPRRHLLHPRLRRPLRGEHDHRPGLHRPRRADLRSLAPGRRPRSRRSCSASPRSSRASSGPARLADPVGVPAAWPPTSSPSSSWPASSGRPAAAGRRRPVYRSERMTAPPTGPPCARRPPRPPRRAYAPYSRYPVGAAGVVDDGSVIVTGCNVENASYGAHPLRRVRPGRRCTPADAAAGAWSAVAVTDPDGADLSPVRALPAAPAGGGRRRRCSSTGGPMRRVAARRLGPDELT